MNREKQLLSEARNTEIQSNSSTEYAIGFTISYFHENTYLVVKDPWKANDTLATYLIVQNEDTNYIPGRVDFTISLKPRRIAVLSSSCLGMLELLQEDNLVIACNNARLIFDSVLYNRFLRGKLTDLGESADINEEAVIGASPDMVMKYIYGGKESADDRIISAGIPIVYVLEFMEPHPLGRAEWIKFAAAFLGKESFADSVFHVIREQYQSLSVRAAKAGNKPTVLDGSSYKGVWYTAGGKSFPAHLYADAGAAYYWSFDSSRGSIPVSLEVILDKQADADYWIGPSSGSRRELLGIESRYGLLKAFRTGNVFNYGKRINCNGGLDYYESGTVRPDILLRDLLWVFHRELIDSTYQPFYIQRIKD